MNVRTSAPAVVLAGLAPCLAHAQIFQIATYSPNVSQVANDVVDTRDCGYTTVGTQFGQTFAPLGIVQLDQFDSNGTLFNNRLYGIANTQSAGYTLVEARGGGYILGAENSSIGVLGKWIIRTDAAANLVWSTFLPGTAFFNAPQRVLGVSVWELGDTSIVSVNRVLNFANVPFGGVLSRQLPNGVSIFTRVYNTTSAAGGPLATDFADVRTLLTPAAQPDLIVVGNAMDTTGLFRAIAIRFDVNGNVVWARSYSLPGTNIFADSVVRLPDGDVVFCGRRGAYVPGQQDPTDMIVARIGAAAGALAWADTVDKFQPGYQAIRFDPTDRDVAIAGTFVNTGTPAVTRTASMIKFRSSTGAFDGAELYSSFTPGTTNTGNGLTFFNPWGGLNLVGATNDIAPANAILMVKSFTTLISGCREVAYTPGVAPVVLSIANLPLTITPFNEFTNPQVLSIPWTQLQAQACFKKRCVGDLNGDGLVDDADFVIFAAAYDILICPTDPRFTCCPADFNGDGLVDDADFVLFANAYDDLLCP